MYRIWIFLHFVGIIFGAGAVTVAYARGLYFKWHPHETGKAGSLPVIKPLVTIGLSLVVITGMGLYLKHPQVLASTAFKVKMLLVLVLVINHILINSWVRPRYDHKQPLATICNYISLYGWYAIIALSTFI